jgi:protoporphyrin/coproporphyrin ferrochelatase
MIANARPARLRVLEEAPETRAPKPVVILMNVGTPEAPTTGAVRRYLKEFLSDPRVLDMPALLRWLLLRIVILPFRSSRSAALYRSIWTAEGSPLLIHTRRLADKLRARVPQADIVVAMRYGAPSLGAAIDEVARRGATQVVLAPLYPQYASASTGTALEEAYRLLGRLPRVPDVAVLPPFFDDEGFVGSFAATFEEATNGSDRSGPPAFDHVLFSYHSVPLRQVQQVHPTCAGDDACCATLGPANASCYRAQCLATTRALARRLGLEGRVPFSTSFQSRLGRAVWLGPSTESTLTRLGERGVKRLAVLCPSFVSDCLETVEEIGVRAKETFQAAGGEELIAVPCPNERDDIADALAELLFRTAPNLRAEPATPREEAAALKEADHG